MATEIRKITLTEYNNLSGPAYSVQYSTDCITYSQSMDCTNLFLPGVGSFGFCTVDDNTTCIRLTSINSPCTNSVVEDLTPTTTTTSTTTTAGPTTTTTAGPTTTTTTAAPTTTTTSTTSTTTTAAPTTTTTSTTTTTTTSTTSTTTTTLQPVWYSLYNCIDGTTQYSTQKTAGTFVVNERVTFGGAFWYVIAELTSNPGESLINVVSVGGPGVTGCPTTTTTTTAAPTTTTTSTTSTTTTAAPTTTTTTIPSACYTLETVQSSQGECFDCPGYFASTTDTVMKIFTACSGSEIFPPFDIFVESRYSDNSTGSLFFPAGYTSSMIIATSDVQCVAPPTCGEIASPTFVSASITSTTGSITECCV